MLTLAHTQHIQTGNVTTIRFTRLLPQALFFNKNPDVANNILPVENKSG
jgi:hypothetical protein